MNIICMIAVFRQEGQGAGEEEHEEYLLVVSKTFKSEDEG
jgi:hypothetical protein